MQDTVEGGSNFPIEITSSVTKALPVLFFTKVRNVKSPTRGTERSAGIDFFVPLFTDHFLIDLQLKNPELNRDDLFVYKSMSISPVVEKLLIFPHQRILIPSGIHIRGIDGYALIAHNKSGVATKKGFDKLAEVIDEDYQGEIHLSVVNTSNEIQYIFPEEKLLQCILIPVLYSDINELTNLTELYPQKTERAEGGFGSTGV